MIFGFRQIGQCYYHMHMCLPLQAFFDNHIRPTYLVGIYIFITGYIPALFISCVHMYITTQLILHSLGLCITHNMDYKHFAVDTCLCSWSILCFYCFDQDIKNRCWQDRNLMILFLISGISKEDLCLEPGTQRVHIHMYCNLAPLRFIQNVLKVNLIRLANTETCDGAGVNDEACLCRAKSRSIARGFKACIGQSGCDIFLGYFDVVDCVKRVGVPMMLKIEYECGLGTYQYNTDGPMTQQTPF